MSATTVVKGPQLNDDIVLTAKAVAQVKKIKSENNIPDQHGLRLGGRGGGCSGLTYVLGFDEKPRDNDMVWEVEGVADLQEVAALGVGQGGHGPVVNHQHVEAGQAPGDAPGGSLH